ncbi:MAG: molybdopterin-dependent oxidoreductase [Armatimonadota bacterium]|nr:molybdopterin-dependent oxidoreductase [Armatimonadota bacterium]
MDDETPRSSSPQTGAPEGTLTRRQLFKTSALLGSSALLAAGAPVWWQRLSPSLPPIDAPDFSYPLADPENILYGVCLQCNTQCTLKTKIQGGLVVKIDGNPYSPMNLQPHLPYGASPDVAARVDGSICPKGQAGVQTLYDPYRIRKVLKRAGPRGSGKWKSIPFEQAIAEIVEGGRLFAEIGEERVYPGFREVFALKDAALAKAMGDDVKAIRAGKLTVEAFQEKYRDHLDVLIDPNHPDLGPKNNQFVFMGGRIGPDREVFAKRFTFGGVGSINWYAHTTICEQAHHVAFKLATAQWKEKEGTFSWDPGTNHMKPDFGEAEFVIFWGTGFNEANFGPTPLGPQVSQALVDGKLKIAVIDPRLSKSAAKGWWIPVRPGGDLALAMGMLRWIIEHRRYDEAFLRHANKAAAVAGGEKSWTNATWLVNAETGRLVRASEIKAGSAHEFVVLVGGRPVAVDPNDEKRPVVGDLDVSVKLGDVDARSGFRLLKESVFAHSLEFYAQESGVDLQTLADLADEFTAHGKKAAIDFYRGPIKFTYGYYAAQAIILLNYLIGNVDHQGGLQAGGGSWNALGDKPGQPFNMKTLHTGALSPFGVKLTREASGPYETSTLFKRDGYPAKRPWFPFTDDVYQEIIPAAAAGYPYPIKILWLHYGTPALANPAGHLQIKMLQDPERIPLFIATDIVIGESSMYADYLFPDLSYLERWGNPMGTSPATMTRTTKVRQPVAAPVPEIVSVDGEAMPISMDAVMLAVAKRLRAPGYGRDGFAPGMPFNRPEEFYLKMVANVAWGDKEGDAVPEAGDGELELFRRARRHLSSAVFDEAKWRRAVGAHWRRTVTVLNRGGRFEAAETARKGAFVPHPWGKQLNVYIEPVGTGVHSITGARLSGVPVYERLKHLDGREVTFPPEYDLALLTYKEIFGGQSRTAGNYIGQLALMPENFVYISVQDARRMGLQDGDVVRITAPGFDGTFEVGPGQTSAVQGKVRPIEGIRPGAVAVSWHYGHWAYGARDVEIDGELVKGEAARGRGLVANPAVLVDGYLKDLCLTDPIAGDSVFNGVPVKLELVARAPRLGFPRLAVPRTGGRQEGPRANLAQPADRDHAAWAARAALEVVRGRRRAEDLRAEILRRLGRKT